MLEQASVAEKVQMLVFDAWVFYQLMATDPEPQNRKRLKAGLAQD
jgi:hypothetical protein